MLGGPELGTAHASPSPPPSTRIRASTHTRAHAHRDGRPHTYTHPHPPRGERKSGISRRNGKASTNLVAIRDRGAARSGYGNSFIHALVRGGGGRARVGRR